MTKNLHGSNKTDIIQLANESTGTVFDTVNQSSHLIWWGDDNGRLLMSNNTFIQYAGYRDLDQVLGSHYSEQPSEGGEFCEEWLYQDGLTREAHGRIDYISYLKSKRSNDRILFHCIKHPAYDSNGTWIGTVNHGFDVTNTKAASWLPLLCTKEESLPTYKNDGAFTFVLTERFVNNRHQIQLTKRQSECLFLLLRGYNTREIAEILGRSKRTVEDHMERLGAQLNAYTRSEIINRAMDMGFTNLIPKGHLTKILKL